MNLLTACAAILVWGGAQLTSGGTVTGIIRLPGGAPAAGVRVAAMVVPGVRVAANEVSIAETITQTDSSGRYQLDGISPGRYLIAAGLLTSPTFHPGTPVQTAATIVTVTQGMQPLAGIDFTVSANPTVVNGRILLSGRVLMEDGNLLPHQSPVALPNNALGLRVLPQPQTSSSQVYDDGSFQLPSMEVGASTQMTLRNLPPGYVLKSVVYGGKNVGLAPVVIDASLTTIDLILGFDQISTPEPVIVRGKAVNVPRELKLTSVSLTSVLSGGPTVVAPFQADGAFELSSVPGGVYRTGGRNAAGQGYISSTVIVIQNTVSNLTIDFRDNPFPDFEGGPPRRYAFPGNNLIELKGVVTQKLTPIKRPDSEYFRMDVKDATTSVVTPWGIYVDHDWQAPRIVVGETVVVPGIASTDGTNRLSAVPF